MKNTAACPRLFARSHTARLRCIYRRADILHHRDGSRRNSQYPRSFWSLLIPLSHPSHSSALPLTSLTASLNLSCTSFLPTRKRKKRNACAKKNSWSERRNSVLGECMQGQRCGERSEGSPPRRAPTNPFFFFFSGSVSFLSPALPVSLWLMSTAFLPLTIQLWPPRYAMSPHCLVSQFWRHCVFWGFFLRRRRVRSENTIGFVFFFLFSVFCLNIT